MALVQQSSGASSVQHFCAVLQDTCMCCLNACFDSKPSKAVHLSSMSGDAVHGCLKTWWPLSSRAVVLVPCSTLVLYFKLLACDACKQDMQVSCNTAQVCCTELAPLLCLTRATRFAGSHVQHYRSCCSTEQLLMVCCQSMHASSTCKCLAIQHKCAAQN